jgi:hypothetical protein
MEFDHPLVFRQRVSTLGVAGLLIGEADEEMRPAERNTPDGRIGKKSLGPSRPNRWIADGE